MRRTKKILWAFFFLMSLLIVNPENAFANISDDEVPDIKARVARISVLRGSAQIKRVDSRDWERAAQNLPIVEGDEITTDSNSRLEIQFNSQNFLRLSENAYLKITTLRDEGIAVSLPAGTLSLRVLEFNKDRQFFEIDAPQTTIAVQNAGMYRIDAGDNKGKEVRVTVTDSGQARIYSNNSGFSLRNGRSARVYLDGDYAGEWETSDAARYADEFDAWALERDAVIAKRLRDAHYDKYYDRDIYGAEELNDYGEWIYTKKYGYVWRPFRTATSSYDDWSPYRYGQWRWIPPFGWTWVNDEPWGWATYHHGRWVYVNDDWAWTPYPQHRAGRSWWRPALVVVTYSGSLICWYPLPYHHGYYNYNHYSSTRVDRRRYNTTIINNNNTTIVVNPTPTPQGTIREISDNGKKEGRNTILPVDSIPPRGVISVIASDFGKERRGFLITPSDIARNVLSKEPTDVKANVFLPTPKIVSDRAKTDVRAVNPIFEKIDSQIKTGAVERRVGVSMDANLRQERIYENRPAIERNPRDEVRGGDEAKPEIRDTGAIKRLPRVVTGREKGNGEIKESTPGEVPPNRLPTIRNGGKSEDDNQNAPVFKARENNRDREQLPTVIAPTQREERRERPQPQPEKEEPRSEPQPRREEPPPLPKVSEPSRKDESKPEPKPPQQLKDGGKDKGKKDE